MIWGHCGTGGEEEVEEVEAVEAVEAAAGGVFAWPLAVFWALRDR